MRALVVTLGSPAGRHTLGGVRDERRAADADRLNVVVEPDLLADENHGDVVVHREPARVRGR